METAVPPIMEMVIYGAVVAACVHHMIWGRRRDAERLAEMRRRKAAGRDPG
ncbi:hypothetical protein [Rhodoplanes sp. SY1]|uniref:hypothetical protein n=1 Tax=Rhodoplanes sp. SY1 TaxID=3166646 RepID=UPI0038B47FD2